MVSPTLYPRKSHTKPTVSVSKSSRKKQTLLPPWFAGQSESRWQVLRHSSQNIVCDAYWREHMFPAPHSAVVLQPTVHVFA